MFASNGIEAIRCNQQLRPDIIIMDISMPQMNGLEASRQILKDSPRTEILLITLLTSEDLVKTAFSFGVHGHVLKSDADQDLVEALKTIQDHRIYVSPAINRNILVKLPPEVGNQPESCAPVVIQQVFIFSNG